MILVLHNRTLCKAGATITAGTTQDISGAHSRSVVQELTSAVPDIFLKAITVDQRETKSVYECPAYKSKSRRTT